MRPDFQNKVYPSFSNSVQRAIFMIAFVASAKRSLLEGAVEGETFTHGSELGARSNLTQVSPHRVCTKTGAMKQRFTENTKDQKTITSETPAVKALPGLGMGSSK